MPLTSANLNLTAFSYPCTCTCTYATTRVITVNLRHSDIKRAQLIENLCAFLMEGWKSVHALGFTCE